MKNILLSLSVLLFVGTFSACKKNDNTPSTNAAVMFVHGCASGTASISVDAQENGIAVNSATNMSFLKSSGYQNVPAGSAVGLSFKVTGLSTLTNGSENLTAGSHYTAFAGGSITSPSFVFAADDLTAPSAGNAKVRFVNLCPDGLNTICYVGTARLDSNVAYQAVTPFFEVAASTIKIEMIDQTVLTNSADIPAQVLSPGKIYTFMLTGTVSGSGSSVLTLTAINNN